MGELDTSMRAASPMSQTASASGRLIEAAVRRKEVFRYLELFEAAFDQLHGAVVNHVKSPSQYVGPHHTYPIMSLLDSGFPSFQEAGFFRDDAPRDYVGTVRPRGLAALLTAAGRPNFVFTMGAELAEFLRSHEVGHNFNFRPLTTGKPEERISDWLVERLVEDAVERYLYLYGLDAPIDPKRRIKIIYPLVMGTISESLDLTLVVPVAITHFEVDRFPLTGTAYITRLPRKLQLARSRMSTRGSGAVEMVVGAATHAFVFKDWNLQVSDIADVRTNLSQPSPNVLDAIDSFFGALRIVTGISTGYAQMLWVPRKWALDYFCDLTPVYGATLRQYPSEYDNYGWAYQKEAVTRKDLNEVRRIYRAIIGSNSEAVRLALKRLNRCLTRTDAADAILDGTIGLELLLGDDQNQSLSYKLRLRAAALAVFRADPDHPATEVATQVRRLYDARSAIVHGLRKKRSKKASEPADTRHANERSSASDLLRFVLDVLLTHPEYQVPAKIDEGLLLRGDEILSSRMPENSRRGRPAKRIAHKG